MKTIQFILSIILSLLALGMLIGAITHDSPIKIAYIALICIICAGCASLVNISYKELKEE